MTEPSGEVNPRMNILEHLEELRRRLMIWIAALTIAGVWIWTNGKTLMTWVTAPIARTSAQLIYLDPTEAFNAYLKVVLLAAFIVCVPVMLQQIWSFLAPAFPKTWKRRIILWLLLLTGLFVAGILFAYFVIIPAALTFLIQFGNGLASPTISVDKYVSFFNVFLLGCGAIFEIPLIMAFCIDLGLIHTKFLTRQRHIAVIVILIIAAIVTPTQDVFNMLVMAVPIYVLFELGIMLGMVFERRRKRT